MLDAFEKLDLSIDVVDCFVIVICCHGVEEMGEIDTIHLTCHTGDTHTIRIIRFRKVF